MLTLESNFAHLCVFHTKINFARLSVFHTVQPLDRQHLVKIRQETQKMPSKTLL